MKMTLDDLGRKVAALLIVIALLDPLPSEAVPPRRLVEVADLSGPVVSPDGRQVAFRMDRASIERNTYDTVWYVQDMDGNAPPRRVADGGVQLHDMAGGALPAEARWAPDGRSIFYLALLDGRIDVWRASADGSGAEPVTFDAADVRDFALSDDGTSLRYSVGATRDEILQAEQDEYDRGVHATAALPVGQGVFRSGYSAGRLATQRFSGVGFSRDGVLAGIPERWKEIDLLTRKRNEGASPGPDGDSRAGSGPQGQVLMEAVRDPRTGRVAALTHARAANGAQAAPDIELAILPGSAGGQGMKCLAKACAGAAITSVQWRPGAAEVLFTTSPLEDGWAQSIFRWNIDTDTVLPVVQSRGLVNGGREVSSSCGISALALACVVAEADRPPRLERIDIDTGSRKLMFDPNDALRFDLVRSVSSRFLRWKDANGREFTGQLFDGKAPAAASRPLFVTYYSCTGFLRGGTGDEWPLASFADAGIAALCINARPHQPDPIARYDEGASAVKSVVELLANEGVIDPDRVGMGGLSFGSEVTLWVATETDLLAAASVTSPSVSPLYYLMGSLQGERFFAGLRAAWGLGAPEATPKKWRRISPAFNRERIRTPVLLQMPEEEYLYALDYVIPMVRENRADLYIFPHEAHQKFQPVHKAAAYERNLDWFRYWLQDFESGSPEKSGQYERWRAMRVGMRGAAGP
ncbi:Atxe2 family lasso peptide isopeptidase [Luteimonas notoginsengisoli]|uniref:Atxe2 family lasso peptide isopeptidase n=1 Tax=Luteimonas notoginsengisoli TaxID=1578200 RepID=A0ABV7UU80_9GAMM